MYRTKMIENASLDDLQSSVTRWFKDNNVSLITIQYQATDRSNGYRNHSVMICYKEIAYSL